ncbi:DUF4150 domain-containing protein [Alcaligenes endophyticus]|uniref:DUF4150 domain-containing protein n=1 Tax=Alcaligenes endophyticus TaxID=1929088 RepID=A0ABT8EKP7_9BURK|nr:DUF4150 domain-containing protein [Alcaligenes endophyticus]MCX5590758.1 DUF4150 domain-containing protein [Alcaligenes endophyticus]MDN4121879.1 DUF4150 domain-containing protein [Alcaligenes endophyticus]
MFSNTQMMGMDLGFPDVCLTPPALVPIPYPDIALGPTAIPVCFNILHCFAPVHNLMTITPITNGDNPGIATGVISHTVMGPSSPRTGAFTCLNRFAPTTRLTSINTQNAINTVGMRIVPSQLKVLVLAP